MSFVLRATCNGVIRVKLPKQVKVAEVAEVASFNGSERVNYSVSHRGQVALMGLGRETVKQIILLSPSARVSRV